MGGANTSNFPNCEDPVCKDTETMMKDAMARVAKKKATAESAAALGTASDEAVSQDEGCPLDKGELGNATWGLVHTTAAHYPDKPSKELKNHTKAFFAALGQLYPCIWCREDFKEEIVKDPPSVESRVALSLWACRQHNTVNEKLGKPIFECTMPKLDERWKKGKPSCWETPKAETSSSGDDGEAKLGASRKKQTAS